MPRPRTIDDIMMDDVIEQTKPQDECDKFSATVLSVDYENNELKVRIRMFDSNRLPWEETWNLEHTRAGLKQRFYRHAYRATTIEEAEYHICLYVDNDPKLLSLVMDITTDSVPDVGLIMSRLETFLHEGAISMLRRVGDDVVAIELKQWLTAVEEMTYEHRRQVWNNIANHYQIKYHESKFA